MTEGIAATQTESAKRKRKATRKFNQLFKFGSGMSEVTREARTARIVKKLIERRIPKNKNNLHLVALASQAIRFGETWDSLVAKGVRPVYPETLCQAFVEACVEVQAENPDLYVPEAWGMVGVTHDLMTGENQIDENYVLPEYPEVATVNDIEEASE